MQQCLLWRRAGVAGQRDGVDPEASEEGGGNQSGRSGSDHQHIGVDCTHEK